MERPGTADTPGHAARLLALATLACGLASCGTSDESAPARLPALGIVPGSVTVSGISGGGYMAVQFHVAHSNLVHGAGIVAAGPYYCAEDSMRLALGRCMQGDEPIPTEELVGVTSRLALEESIDPIANLADDRVWIFHGAADSVIARPVADSLEAYYALLVEPRNIKRIEHPTAGHTFPTASAGAGACAASASPYIGRCGVDGARALLEHLYGPLRPGRAPAKDELGEFDQRPYAGAAGSESLADRGWLFVPSQCRSRATAKCRLHIVFHDCRQGASFVGDAFVRTTGYLEAAAANDIVVLFPQVDASYQPLNPNGCWDWWGYEGDGYALQRGPQIRAVRAMVGDLLGERTPQAR